MSLCLAVVLLFLTTISAQQDTSKSEAPKPEFQLETLYLVILEKTSRYEQARAEKISNDHQAYWQKIADEGQLLLAGPILDGTMDGVVVFRAQSKDEAVAIAGKDPMVEGGMWKPSVHPWGTKKNVLKPLTKVEPANIYFLGFLKRGDKWSPEETPERQRIQEAHLKNIGRLHEMGKLVAAGPFMEDTDLRGIFVFKTATLEEANQLTNTDPAVQAGRLRIELHPWKLPSSAFAQP